jgi:hypothetical protein
MDFAANCLAGILKQAPPNQIVEPLDPGVSAEGKYEKKQPHWKEQNCPAQRREV